MFIVTYEDGSVEVQGREVLGWDDVSKSKRIVSVTITDGHEIQETLFGFDFYLVCYHGVAVLRSSAGETFGTQLPPKVYSQSLFGIRSNDELVHTIKKLASAVRAGINKSFPTELIETSEAFARARRNDFNQIDDSEKKLLDWASKLEVVEVSLTLSKKNYSRDELKQNPDNFRAGIGGEMGVTEEDIMKYLRLK